MSPKIIESKTRKLFSAKDFEPQSGYSSDLRRDLYGKLWVASNEWIEKLTTNFGFIRKYDYANDLMGIYGKDASGVEKISIVNIGTEKITESVSCPYFSYNDYAFVFCGSGADIRFYRIRHYRGRGYIYGNTFPALVEFNNFSWRVRYYASEWEATVDEDNTNIFLNYWTSPSSSDKMRKYDIGLNMVLEGSTSSSYGLGVNDSYVVRGNFFYTRYDKDFTNPFPGPTSFRYTVPCAGGKDYFFGRNKVTYNSVRVVGNDLVYITDLDGCYCYNNFLGHSGHSGTNGVLPIALTQNYIVTIVDSQTLNVYDWSFNLVKQITSDVNVPF